MNDIITPVSRGGMGDKLRAFIDKKRKQKDTGGIVPANPFTVDMEREMDRYNRRMQKEREERIVTK